jgi:DNA-directed RNA polymerase sigma subunit (sigma70/sigma32)
MGNRSKLRGTRGTNRRFRVVLAANTIAQPLVSLETRLGRSKTAPTGEIVEDKAVASPSGTAIQFNFKGRMNCMLRSLPSRNEGIVKMRFRLDGSEHTLAEVGKASDVTRERIGPVEDVALRRLRQPVRSDRFRVCFHAQGRKSA